MDLLTLHGANRVLERGIPVDAIKKISDQTALLETTRRIISPALTSHKLLKFRFRGRSFAATPDRITTVIKIGGNSFVVGMNADAKHPVIVTCWQN